MRQIIECVPNFSEGVNLNIIKEITDIIEAVDGVTLLDVDPGRATNRTVVTFVGEPEPVIEAAFLGIKKASELIDMKNHSGEHPRMGATDVCPLIPISNISLDQCIPYAERLAKMVGEELHIPSYLYGKAAKKENRVKLPDIREGEYEALEGKLQNPDFKPDFGEAIFNSKSGATAFGVRDFLLAYNINLNSKDAKFAKDIALTIRERGRAKRDSDGEILRDANGVSIKVPGLLENCQAGGWYIDEYGYAQVTMNLTNYHNIGLHTAFDVVVKEAEKFGLRVTGSEVVGLLPKKAILDAGLHYLKKSNKNIGIPEKDIVHIGILSLGLNDTTPFDAKKKIIEYAIEAKKSGLKHLSITDFVTELSSDSMAPGGGSIAALNGALSAGLTSMVANLTHGKKGYIQHDKMMTEVSIDSQHLKGEYIELIDSDTDSFNSYILAVRMPKKSEQQITLRNEALENAAKAMTLIPMRTLRGTLKLQSNAEIVLKNGNRNALSDATVAIIQSEAAATGAFLNVKINLPSVKDEIFKKDILEEAEEILQSIKLGRKRLEGYALKELDNE
ncbi:MAG: glutamate formimidoyltransferase [Spirochaetaceae bacterium]